MIVITQRCIKLLALLCEQTGPVAARKLAESLNVSERTVRYDLELLSQWLAERGVALRSVPKKGIFLAPDGRQAALALLREHHDSEGGESRFLNADERVRMIVTDILEGRSSYSFDEAPALFGVSRATFIRDLKKADEWFAAHGARLLRRQKRGVRVSGDEIAHRRLIIDFIMENSNQKTLVAYFMTYGRGGPVPKPSAFAYINRIFCTADLGAIIDTADQYLKSSGLTMSDDDFIGLIYYLAVMVTRVGDGHFLDSIPEAYRRFGESAEFEEIFLLLSDKMSGRMPQAQMKREALYLTACLSAAAKNAGRPGGTDNSETARQISTLILQKIRQDLHCDLAGDSELVNTLKIHLQAAIMRMQLHLPAHNPMLEEITRKFQDVFAFCTQLSREIASRFGVRFDEDEIGFITLYIAVAMQREKQSRAAPDCVRATLICGYGVGTVTFLMNSLSREFPHISIVDKLSIFDIYEYDFSKVDLIFTTIDIPLPLTKPLIKVSPILTRLDIRRIDAFLRTGRGAAANTTQEFQINELLSVIGRHCDIRDTGQLAKDLKKVVGPYEAPTAALSDMPGLLDILPKKYVIAGVEAADWEDAVWKAAQPLIESGCTSEEYVREIIDIRDRYNQYALISNGICTPHASPSLFNKAAFSLVTFKAPVTFELDGQNVEVYAMMLLSLSDSMTHAKALDEVFTLLDEFPELPVELQKAASTAELCRILKYYYERLF